MRVGIALGSNLGDRATQLRAALTAIREFAEPPILISRVYETEPVDCPPGSPSFLNAAIEIGYTGEIDVLLKRLQAIERQQGRPLTRGKNAPRTVDLDILYVDEWILDQSDLKLPHPRLMSRAFVLLPLCDIASERKLPGQILSFREAANAIKNHECKISDMSINE